VVADNEDSANVPGKMLAGFYNHEVDVVHDRADDEWPVSRAAAMSAMPSIWRIEPTMAFLHRIR
jgi:hypothetical protein